MKTKRLLVSNVSNELRVGGLVLQAQSAVKHTGLYSLELDYGYFPEESPKATWPGIRIMRRLAREFLGCGYQEDHRSRNHSLWLFFEIDTGLPLEKRAAFLAAVCTHTKIGHH